MTQLTKSLFAAAALTAAMGAQAATSASISVPQSTIIYDVEENPGSISFAQFDSHLGTLTSVQFQLFSTLHGSITLKNTAASPALVNYGVKAGADLVATLAGQSVTADNWIAPAISLSGGQSKTLIVDPVTTYQSLTFSLPSDLSGFIGNGTVSAGLSAESLQKLTAGGSASLGTNLTVDGYALVTYTYEVAAVPEPETYAMLLAGLGLVGAIARRRRA